MPRPTSAHKKLERLAGQWTGREQISPSPWDPRGGPAVGRVRNRVVLDGFAVIQEYEQERDGGAGFKGHGVFRWDVLQNCYVFHWFDSMGMPPTEYRGTFEGDVLKLTAPAPQGQSRAVFDLAQPNKYTFRLEVSQDGKTWHPFLEGKYEKQP